MKKIITDSIELSSWTSLLDIQDETEKLRIKYSIETIEEMDVEIRASIDYDDSPELNLYFRRSETDEEYQTRLDQEKKDSKKAAKKLKQIQEARELNMQLLEVFEKKEYERLKAKYEKA